MPVELHGGPIGSLDLYSARPRDWDDSEIGALQAYAGIVANLLPQEQVEQHGAHDRCDN